MTKLLQLVNCPLLCNLIVYLGELGVKNVRKGFHGISIIYDLVAIINITTPEYRMYYEVSLGLLYTQAGNHWTYNAVHITQRKTFNPFLNRVSS